MELRDTGGNVIYRKSVYTERGAFEEFKEGESFYVIAPNLKDADSICIFAPPAEDNAERAAVGFSACVAEFKCRKPEDVRANAGITFPSDIVGEGLEEVLGYKQILASGNVRNVYNLILLAEKFTDDNQDNFESVAAQCVSYMKTRPPLDTYLGHNAINVWVVLVKSKHKIPSYFKSIENSEGLPDWEISYIGKVCDTIFSLNGTPYWNWAGLIIDESGGYDYRGCSCGNTFIFTTEKSTLFGTYPWRTFIHELGHSGFNLGDEYSEFWKPYPYGEPDRANITIETDRSKIKWKAFIDSDTPIPTDPIYAMAYPYKAGLIQGGSRYAVGIYHPQFACIMNGSHADVHFCKVCADRINYVLYWALNPTLPVPGVLYYSPASGKWENLTIAAKIDQRYGKLSGKDFDYDALVAELNKETIGGNVKSVMRLSAGIAISDDYKILCTNEKAGDTDTVGLWYLLAPRNDVMYYIRTFKSPVTTELMTGKILLPNFPTISHFEGVSVGLIQHIFAALNGSVSHGVMANDGSIDSFEVMAAGGLSKNVTMVTDDYNGNFIFIGVIDGGKVKIAPYSLATKSFYKDFITMPCGDGTVYSYIKLLHKDNTIYVLAKSAAVEIHTFNITTMAWNSAVFATVPGSETAIEAGIAFYNNTLFATVVSPADSFIKSLPLNPCGEIAEEYSFDAVLGMKEDTAIVSSVGTTVLGNTLHRVYIQNEKAKHDRYECIYDYKQKLYTAQFIDTKEIGLLQPQQKVSHLSIHNNGSVIYLILSAGTEIPNPGKNE